MDDVRLADDGLADDLYDPENPETVELGDGPEPDSAVHLLDMALQNACHEARAVFGTLLQLPSDTSAQRVAQQYNVALQALRAVRAQYQPATHAAAFARFVKRCGLAELLVSVGNPGFMLYQWPPSEKPVGILRLSRVARHVLHTWLRPCFSQLRDDPPAPRLKNPSNARNWVVHVIMERVLIADPSIIPLHYDPYSAFFLATPLTFAAAWREWLGPSVQSRFSSTASWDPAEAYKYLAVWVTNSARGTSWPADSGGILRRLVTLTAQYKSDVKMIASGHRKARVLPGVHNPTFACTHCGVVLGCSTCATNPRLDSHCVRHVIVQRRASITLPRKVKPQTVCIVTNTSSPGSRIPPKSWDTTEDAMRYFDQGPNRNELELTLIAPDEEALATCGQQLVVMYEAVALADPVGGIAYGGTEKEQVQQLGEHLDTVQRRYPSRISRRPLMQYFEYGDMQAVGARLASGGGLGDHYDVYSHMRHSTAHPENLDLLFHHALDAFIMQDILSKALYPAWSLMHQDAKESGIQHFGHSPLTLYYCENYLAPIHRDGDSGFSLALQISKEGCSEGDFDFAYVQYGVRLRTMPGSVWFFHSDAEHGTVMPSVQSLATARCTGIGGALRRRDLSAARKLYDGLRFWDIVEGCLNTL